MNAMQGLAIKYPTLWEHIAKGGKVGAYAPEITMTIKGVLTGIDTSKKKIFKIDNKYWFEEIELLPLPKRVPIKDLGKAVNYFNGAPGWFYNGGFFRNNILEEKLNMDYLYNVVICRCNVPSWWPEELMEDENND